MSILNKRRVAGLCAGLLAAATLAACGSDDGGGDSSSANGGGGSDPCNGETLSMPIAAGWQEDIVTTYMWKKVLEDQGCTVEVEEMDIGVVFQGLSGGDQDLFLDVWAPNTHASYLKEFGSDIEELGTWYDQGFLTLTVPKYMDINSIEELPDIAEKVDGTITGIDPGAGLTKTVKESVIPEYNLGDTFELDISSTATMLTQLESAVKAKEPIVVTLWHPHLAYTQYDLKDLEDPKGALGEAEKLKAYGRTGFSDDFPEIAKAIGNWKMDDKTLMDLEKAAFNEADNPEEGVQAWMEENQDYVDKLM